jgi:hypothetical protein
MTPLLPREGDGSLMAAGRGPETRAEGATFMLIVRILATIISGPMLLMGGIWILQGFNIMPGSFMTGDLKWAAYGAVLAVAGAALVYWLNRRRA